MDTADLIRRASKGIQGRHPEHDFPISNGSHAAVPYTLLALVAEQQTTNRHLVSIASSLERIADAMTKTPEAAPEPEPKRRLWLPVRRRSEE